MNIINLYLNYLNEYNKGFFDYSIMSKQMWRDLIQQAMKDSNVFFDLENNDTMKKQRVIKIPQSFWKNTDCKFKCELFQAGGDWEMPVLYFRCEITGGYALNVSTYKNPHFVFIPGKEQGNFHLIKGGGDKEKWITPNSDDFKEGIDPESNERECWKALEEFLKDLVYQDIEKHQREE